MPALRGTGGSPAAARRAESSAQNVGKSIRRPVQTGSGEVFDTMVATRLFADTTIKIGAIEVRVKRDQPPLMSSEVETPRATVDASVPISQIPPMDRDTALSRLKAHEAELRAMGVAGLSLFGSVARGDAGPNSDVDLAARFDPAAQVGMVKYGAIAERLRTLLRAPIDLVGEPARTARMQAEIDRDRALVY